MDDSYKMPGRNRIAIIPSTHAISFSSIVSSSQSSVRVTCTYDLTFKSDLI